MFGLMLKSTHEKILDEKIDEIAAKCKISTDRIKYLNSIELDNLKSDCNNKIEIESVKLRKTHSEFNKQRKRANKLQVRLSRVKAIMTGDYVPKRKTTKKNQVLDVVDGAGKNNSKVAKKLNDRQCRQIKIDCVSGMLQKDAAVKYNVGASTIGRVINNQY